MPTTEMTAIAQLGSPRRFGAGGSGAPYALANGGAAPYGATGGNDGTDDDGGSDAGGGDAGGGKGAPELPGALNEPLSMW